MRRQAYTKSCAVTGVLSLHKAGMRSGGARRPRVEFGRKRIRIGQPDPARARMSAQEESVPEAAAVDFVMRGQTGGGFERQGVKAGQRIQ